METNGDHNLVSNYAFVLKWEHERKYTHKLETRDVHFSSKWSVISQKKLPGNPRNASFLCCTFRLHLIARSQWTKQQTHECNICQLMQNQG